jgi:hypothetical protein
MYAPIAKSFQFDQERVSGVLQSGKYRLPADFSACGTAPPPTTSLNVEQFDALVNRCGIERRYAPMQ